MLEVMWLFCTNHSALVYLQNRVVMQLSNLFVTATSLRVYLPGSGAKSCLLHYQSHQMNFSLDLSISFWLTCRPNHRRKPFCLNLFCISTCTCMNRRDFNTQIAFRELPTYCPDEAVATRTRQDTSLHNILLMTTPAESTCPWANLSRVVALFWNIELRLYIASHVMHLNQTECLITEK